MTQSADQPGWWIFQGAGTAQQRLARLPPPPPWRRFEQDDGGQGFILRDEEIDLVNAALYLRRPLLITGKPGVGKTSLTYAVAKDLGLGAVLRWSITSSTRLRDGLYHYDPIARLQDASLQRGGCAAEPGCDPDTAPPIGHYLRLGPLGTAFAASRKQQPRVLLIDEIDKSDIDLPNDLLHIFEQGAFTIPELERLPDEEVRILPDDARPKSDPAVDGLPIVRGRVRCAEFPLVIMTSNAEREFPPAFLRRCLKLDMAVPDKAALIEIVKVHLFGPGAPDAARLDEQMHKRIADLVDDFLARRDPGQDLAADQLLNAVYLVLRDADPERRYGDRKALRESLWRPLSE